MHENRGSFTGETETKKPKRKWKKPVPKLKEDSLKNSDSSLISIEEFDIRKFIQDLKEILDSKGSIPESIISILGTRKIVEVISLLLRESNFI